MRSKTILVTLGDMEKFIKGQLRQAISNAPVDLKVESWGASPDGIHLLCTSSKWPDVETPEEFQLVMKMPGSR